MDSTLAGQLLVASPAITDPRFSRTVVLVGAHNADGAIGVVLNHPSATTIGDALPELEPAVCPADQVFVGGPVKPASVVLLAEFIDPAPAALLVLGRIGFPTKDTDLGSLAGATARSRVYAGYAGWGDGQLDEELARGDWFPHPAAPDDVFTQEPEQLWSSVLKRKGGAYVLLSRMPKDPSVN